MPDSCTLVYDDKLETPDGLKPVALLPQGNRRRIVQIPMSLPRKLLLLFTIVFVAGSTGWTTWHGVRLRTDRYHRKVVADLTDFFELPCQVGTIEPRTFSSALSMTSPSTCPIDSIPPPCSPSSRPSGPNAAMRGRLPTNWNYTMA